MVRASRLISWIKAARKEFEKFPAEAPSAAGLTRFFIDQGFHDVELKLNGKDGQSKHWLVPMVSYSGVKYPIRLGDSTQVSFTIKQDASDSVIQLNREGLVRALRVGKATITAEFAGVPDEIRVVVKGD